MIKKGIERITQSVQAHHPRLIAEVLDGEEDEDHHEVSPPLLNHHSMTAIVETPEPIED